LGNKFQEKTYLSDSRSNCADLESALYMHESPQASDTATIINEACSWYLMGCDI